MSEKNKHRNEEILSHQTEVDIDGIWAAIEPQVDIINAEKKRKKRYFFFFLFGAILLAGGGIYAWQNGFAKAETIAGIEKNIAYQNENIIPSIIDMEVECVEEKAVVISAQVADNKENKKEGSIISAVKEEAKAAYSPKSTTKFSEELLQNKSSKEIAKTIVSDKSVEGKSERVKNEEIASVLPLEKYSIVQNIPTLTAELADGTDVTIPALEITPLEEEKEKDLPGGKLSFALGANAGFSFINRDLYSNVENVESPDVLELRRSSESLLEAQHYSINGKLTHKSGFSLTSGLQYTLMTERYDNRNREVVKDSIDGIVKRVIQFSGDTLDVLGMVPRTRTYVAEKEIFNRYRMLDIPVLIGFEGGREEWSIGVQAGVFVNLSLNTSGKVRSTVETDLDIGENQAEIFRDKVGLSYYGGLYIRREITPYLDVTIAPHARFFNQKFTVDEYALSQKYSLFGVQVGLSYRFGY